MTELFNRYKTLDTVSRLIVIILGVAVISWMWDLVLFLFELPDVWHCRRYLALPAYLYDFIASPWTLFTYMFVHGGLFHLLFNLLWLYWFGRFFMRYHTGRQFLSLFLTGGLFSGVFFLLSYNIFPCFSVERFSSSVVGASGAIFALIVAVAVRQPDETLTLNFFLYRFNLKMKWLALAVLIISSMSPHNMGGSVCHVGGALWGVIYGLSERKGKDITRWWERLSDFVVNLFKPKPRMKVHQGERRAWKADREKEMDYKAREKEREERIDAILDKMRKSGYNGLSEEEKRYLFEAGKK